jgi:hypothetical protein
MPEVTTSVQKYFGNLPDPRKDNRTQHLLMDILSIALCAIISGAEGFNGILTHQITLAYFKRHN